MKNLKFAACMIAIAWGFAAPLAAQSLLIDTKFENSLLPQTYTGPGIVGVTGDQWNFVTSGNSNSSFVIDSAGNLLSPVSMFVDYQPDDWHHYAIHGDSLRQFDERVFLVICNYFVSV